MRSLAATNRKRARPPERLTTFANRSAELAGRALVGAQQVDVVDDEHELLAGDRRRHRARR